MHECLKRPNWELQPCSRRSGDKDLWKESDRNDGKEDQDSRSAPEPKKPEEKPASTFSSASEHPALWMVKMKMREKNTPVDLYILCFFPSLSPP
jgi:hypothetical protein